MLTRPTAFNPNGTRTAHLVQLFDSDRSLSFGVAQFLRQGLVQNEQILVVMNGERWNAVAMRRAALGATVEEALRVSGVRQASSRVRRDGGPARQSGQYAAALELEEFWHEVATQHPFTVLGSFWINRRGVALAESL